MANHFRNPAHGALRNQRLRVSDLPELNVAIFAFLLNFVWEMWQVPFFVRVPVMPHWRAVWVCTLATGGDVLIALVSFWTVVAVARSRRWILHPSWWQVAGFAAVGVAITIVAEAVALAMGRWRYSNAMPTLPLLGTGLVPLLQWTLLPPLVVWFVRGQLGAKQP